jgi:hypothetical protein
MACSHRKAKSSLIPCLACNRHIPHCNSHGCDVVPGCVIQQYGGWMALSVQHQSFSTKCTLYISKSMVNSCHICGVCCRTSRMLHTCAFSTCSRLKRLRYIDSLPRMLSTSILSRRLLEHYDLNLVLNRQDASFISANPYSAKNGYNRLARGGSPYR